MYQGEGPLGTLTRSSADIVFKGDGKDQGASEVKPEPAALVPKDMARVLWSYRGRAVDEGSKDEYELTGYSEGELREFGEGYTVIRKWNHQRDC